MSNYVALRIVYRDLPDLIELGVEVRCDGWNSYSKAYTSLDGFLDEASRLREWARSPKDQVSIKAGADNGIGFLLLKFYTVDLAGHACCAVSLGTGEQARNARPESTWRMAVEMRTELGLIERFAKECVAMLKGSFEEARLEGFPMKR